MLKRVKRERQDSASWHPDFRVPESLPDIRVVRTGTALSILSFAAVAASLIYFGQQEYFIFLRGQELSAYETKAEDEKAALAKRTKLSKDFEALSALLTELSQFGQGQPLPSDVALLVSSLRPDGVLYKLIAVSNSGCTIRVVVRDQNLDALLLVPTALYRKFREHPELTKIYPKIAPPTFDTPKDGVLEFDLVLQR